MNRGVLYRQLCEVLRAGIAGGTYPPGAQLPTEPELMDQYRVSRGTVRSALRMLKDEGLLVSLPSKGTFVASPRSHADVGRENLIALLAPDLDTGYYSRIIRGIERQAFADGFVVRAEATSDLVTAEERCLRALQGKVAGVILAPAALGARTGRMPQDFGLGDLPMVFVDRYLTDYDVDVVCSDNVRGGCMAAQHLLDLGHRRIGIGVLRVCSSFHDRHAGYRQALEAAGIEYDPALVARGADCLRDGSNSEYRRLGELMIQQLMDMPEPPTAFIVPNNMAAVGVLRYLRAAAPEVSEAMAVVGWDGVDSAEYVTPALTTVDQEPQDMGAVAARLLISRIRHEPAPPQRYDLPVTLHVRASTAARPGREGAGRWVRREQNPWDVEEYDIAETARELAPEKGGGVSG